MPDYKEMYFDLFRATERAINILIEAQQKAEEEYVSSPETILTVLADQGSKINTEKETDTSTESHEEKPGHES